MRSIPLAVALIAVSAPHLAASAPVEPTGARVLHLAGHIGQPKALAAYQEMTGARFAPAGDALWLALDQTRPWEYALRRVEHDLTRLADEGRVANLSLTFTPPTRAGFETAGDRRFVETTDWDRRVDDLARVIRHVRAPVLLRIGCEINGAWKGHHPFVFPRAYRKVVERFRAQRVENVAFVFCIAAMGDRNVFAVNDLGEPKWYPGDDVVDWFGINVFRREHFDPAAPARGGRPNLAAFTESFLARPRDAGKPVIIGETTPVGEVVQSREEDPNAYGADDVWDAWFAPFIAFLDRHPEIKAVTLLPIDWRGTRWSDWGDARLHRSPLLARRWRQELEKPRWVHRDDLRLAVPRGL